MSIDRKTEFQGHAQLHSKFEVNPGYMIACLEAPRREERLRGETRRGRGGHFSQEGGTWQTEKTARFLDFGVGRIDEHTVVPPQNRISHNPFMSDDSRLPQLLSFLGDSWGIFLSHPWDFAPVFITEVGRTINLALELVKRNRHIGYLFNRQCWETLCLEQSHASLQKSYSFSLLVPRIRTLPAS